MIGPLPPRPTGTSGAARFFQWVWDSLANSPLAVREVPNALVSRTTRGVFVQPRGATGTGDGRVKQYVLMDKDADDYFVCRTLDSAGRVGVELKDDGSVDPDKALIYIAKDFALRVTEFDGKTFDVEVETWDGATLDSVTKTYTFDYQSSTLRVKTDVTDPDNPVDETQAVIPRFVPAVLTDPHDSEAGEVFVENDGATIIYAVRCPDLSGIDADGDPLTLLALSDGWAWTEVDSE